MKIESTVSLAIALACFASFTPQPARAQSMTGQAAVNTSTTSTVDSAIAQQQAALMVSAKIHLVKALDARKAQPGSQFEAALDGTVHLKNGTELPRGTVLIGTVAAGEMQTAGASHLAVRFTQAKLKDGKVISIQATITGIAGPPTEGGYAGDDQSLPAWNPGSLQTDQEGTTLGVELHSKIAGMNSGEFISSGNDDVKLAAGSRMSLAIAAQS